MRMLDWLTKRRVGWKAVVENSKLALKRIIPWEVLQI